MSKIFARLKASKLARSMLGLGAQKAMAMLLCLPLTAVLARFLGVSEFGAYSFMFATLSLLMLPLIRGLPTLVVRHTAIMLHTFNTQIEQGGPITVTHPTSPGSL